MKSATQDRPTRKPYDPGQIAGITRLSFREGTFLIRPFKKANGEQKEGEYLADLQNDTCTCPHFEHRIAPKREAGEEIAGCKHLQAAREESFKIALYVSRQLSPVNLRKQLLRADLRPEITEALLQVSWERLNTRPGSLPLRAVISTASRAAAELTPAA